MVLKTDKEGSGRARKGLFASMVKYLSYHDHPDLRPSDFGYERD